jgi:hypothetical protein
VKGDAEKLRAELLRVARDLAPAGLVPVLLDWYGSVGELGAGGIEIVAHESALVLEALQLQRLASAEIVVRIERPLPSDAMTGVVRSGGASTIVALEAVRAALEDARAGAGST